MKLRILFVDDDPMVLASTRRQFRKKLDNCELVFCCSASDAIAEISQKVPHVVFSDLRMPGMDGVQFLGKVAATHPAVIRFGWTGQAECEHLNEFFKVTHQVFSKPSPCELLVELITCLSTLQAGFEGSDYLAKIDASELMRFDLALNPSASQLIGETDSSVESIASAIEPSPILQARIACLANSPFFNLSSTVSTPAQAIGAITLDSTRAIFEPVQDFGDELHQVLGTAVRDSNRRGMRAVELVGQAVNEAGLTDADKELSLFAARFHAIGAVQLAILDPDRYQQIESECSGEITHLVQQEREAFGMCRYELSAYFLAAWGLAPRACNAIAAITDQPQAEHSVGSILGNAVCDPSEWSHEVLSS